MVAKARTLPPNHLDGLNALISDFGREVTDKIRTSHGSREDHLRAPLERLLKQIAGKMGLHITMIGETRLPDLSVRPDYAVNVAGARAGYIELKQPVFGVPSAWKKKPDDHDRKQWDKLKLLPNVLYSDGENFARFRFGKLQGRVAKLQPRLDHASSKFHAVDSEFYQIVTQFLRWEPEQPRSLEDLVRLVANLCRLLRDDVTVELHREKTGASAEQTFTQLATDWRQLLFPNLTDKQFADQYAQTVTFALLLASVEGVPFEGTSIGEIARILGKKHSLMGKALAVLTDQPEEQNSVALTTLLRVISAINWSVFPEDAYLMLYEKFLSQYDPILRRKSGVYYTPNALVTYLTEFVDRVLRSRLGRQQGFAENDVIVVDPAMGTGSFLAAVINKVATTVAHDEGSGAVTAQLRKLSNRLIGFENQAAPFAVAELRIHSLLKKRHRAEVPLKERRFLVDTLDDPTAQMLPLGSIYHTIRKSRDDANLVKTQEPVMVVLGNPPYADKAKGTSTWIETPQNDRVMYPSISAFRRSSGGRMEYVLSNKYVYFWRWATWKAFDAHPDHPAGIVAMVCSAGFTTGPGFAGMREYLRQTADEGWIIDLSPEGHQPPMTSRFFRENQQPICMAIFVRAGVPQRNVAATVWRASVTGAADEKVDQLANLMPDELSWYECSDGWGDAFDKVESSVWQSTPKLNDILPWVSPGIMPDRTWIYAPEPEMLLARWRRFVRAPLPEKADLMVESPDTNLLRTKQPLPRFSTRNVPLAKDFGQCSNPTRIAYRSFDRQWIIPDSRLIARPRPGLWATMGPHQIYVTEQHAHPISTGPALTFSALPPDKHHFMGHHAGRVLPLYRDAIGAVANIVPGLIPLLERTLQVKLTPEELLAYIAAVASHPGYTLRFNRELKSSPGVRVSNNEGEIHLA